MQKLSERTANFILRAVRRNPAIPWCRGMLGRFELPRAVHSQAHYRVWQRGEYDMNIWSENRRVGPGPFLRPTQGSALRQPGNWPWSSWRFYYLEDSSILAMDTMP